MQVGDQQWGISIVILFALLFVALIGNIVLFARGHASYSVKYEIFLKSAFFRQHPGLCDAVEVIYHIFFVVPFVLLLLIAIIRATVNGTEFVTIMLNGLVVLLTIYPIKNLWFNTSKLLVWLLVIASQLNTLYLYLDSTTKNTYTLLSAIFYPINGIIFSLASLSNEQEYWQVDQAISLCEQQIKEIYPQFIKPRSYKKEEQILDQSRQIGIKYEVEESKVKKQPKRYNIPDIFDGGIYGMLCRSRTHRGKKSTLIYIISLLVLGINAFLVWLDGSSLGIIGLITNFVYDIFIFAFAALKSEERSVRNIFLLIFLGRIMSFIFGQQLWIFGYCVLYLIVGIFVGRIIINTRLPLQKVKKNKGQRHKREQKNALKTPEFVLFILTVEVFLLVLAASFGVGSADVSYSYSSAVSVPLWQFAMIVVIVTWIVIIFMASYRMYRRQCNNIRQNIEYYFGSSKIRTFHINMVMTYLFVVGLGFYCYYFLKQPTAFLSCIFLPLILLALIKLEHEWVKNQYQILADIKEYNGRVAKAKRIIEKKRLAIENNKKEKKIGSMSLIAVRPSKEEPVFETSKAMLADNNSQHSQTSTQMERKNEIKDELEQLKQEEQGLVELPLNWRTFQGKIGVIQFFTSFLTPSDKWILLMIVSLSIIFAIYVICTYVIAGTIFGMLIVLCLTALLSYSPFYRYSRTYKDLEWPQYIWYYSCFAVGIIYWCFYRQKTIYVMVWSGWYILCGAAQVVLGFLLNIKKQYIYVLLANIAATIIFICTLLFFTVNVLPAALVTVVLFVLSVGAVPIAYNHLEGSTPLAVKLICGGLIVIGVGGIAIVGWISNYVSDFAVFSFVMGSIYIVLFLMGSVMFYDRQNGKYETPHVYSAYGKPVYKFQSRTQQLKSSISHKVIYQLSGIVLVIYACVVTLIFQSKEYAIYILGFYSCVTFLQEYLFAIKTHNELAVQGNKITKQLVEKALLQLKNKYMVDFKSNTYSKLVEQEKKKLKEIADKAKDEELNAAFSNLARKHQEYIKNVEEEQKFLFFWTVLIQFQINTQNKAAMVKLINEVKQIENTLMEYGVFIESVNYNITDLQTKYELVTEEIESLDPFDYINYQAVLAKHQEESLRRSQEQKKQMEIIQKQQKEKDDFMFNKMQNQLKKSSNQKIQEFNQMLGQVQNKKKYIDSEFPADQSTLGSMSSIVTKWRRPKRGETLVKGGFSAYDIKQGSIGDCYLVSSMGVLGQKWIKAALGGCKPDNTQNGTEEWKNQKGAYMVRFYKFLKQVYIVIDDQLPVDNYDNFVFAKSEDPEEIWPGIIEKAYAKLYGGYYNIVEGKCHRVFAQFTGGFPSELLTEDYQANPNSLWQRIVTATQHNYLMAAGSPSHADGDRAHSSRGIVQGHAYAILDARQVQGHRLMKLKNPHGSGGIEWSGDFSDGSEMMTKRLMQLLGHQNKDDGIFWMNLEDFIHQFKSLYLCAIFDDEKWLKVPTIQGKFTQQNSYGLPKASDQTFRNPQYGIRVTKKCTFFVNMVQQAQNSIKGKNTIYLRIQRNQGKRITKHNTRTDLLCGNQLSPIDSITLSNEAILEADSYPYVFTLYVSCGDEGDEGEFKLQIYCSDKQMTVIPDAEFDRELFEE